MVKLWPHFIAAYNQMGGERDGSRKEVLKQEPRIDDLGNSQAVQIAKDAKIW